MATNITITWTFYSSYSSWKLLTYRAWCAAWSGSKLIVERCMHEYVSCLYYGIHCNSHIVYCHGKVQKVMNIKDVFLKRKNKCLKQCIIKQTMHYTLPNKVTVHYPNITHSCCLWSNNPSCNKVCCNKLQQVRVALICFLQRPNFYLHILPPFSSKLHPNMECLVSKRTYRVHNTFVT